jgi:hypothetical protein
MRISGAFASFYGLGMAAYADHAYVLGSEDEG